MSTEKKVPAGSSTKDLARTLGKKELMGIAIGQIIGAGIMSMMGVAIAMTGRSANLAFMLSAVFTMCTFFPSIFITSCIRMRGGMYTQMAIFAGDKWAGYYSVVLLHHQHVPGNVRSVLRSVLQSLCFLPAAAEKVIALVVGTAFFVLNYFGVDLMVKIQNLLVVVLVLSLSMFAVFGLPHVDLVNYFSNADGLFLTDGIGGFLTATAYLGFATGGATVILGVSAECKNPTKDIPFVIIVSTVSVAILYGLVATAAAGVLPVAEVANQPLTLVANKILPQPLYVLFIVGGAMFALATTLNSQIMSCTKPVMQSCEDGWFPQSLASLSKFKTPWKILVIYYVILVVPILLDLQISQISSIVQILGYINNLIFTITAMKLPKMFPEAWEKSAVQGSYSCLQHSDDHHLHRHPDPGFVHAQLDDSSADHLQRSCNGSWLHLGLLQNWQRQGQAHRILRNGLTCTSFLENQKTKDRFIRSFLFLQDRICADAKINRDREWAKLHKTSEERMCNLPGFPENGRERAKTAVPGSRIPKHSA